MRRVLIKAGTKCLETKEEGMINSASGFGRASKRHVAFAAFTVGFQVGSPRQYRSYSGEVPEISFVHTHLPPLRAQQKAM